MLHGGERGVLETEACSKALIWDPFHPATAIGDYSCSSAFHILHSL